MTTASPTPEEKQQAKLLEGFFLPDLCNSRAVLILLVVSEVLVLALTLMETGLPGFSLLQFALVSFYVQWVTLLSVAILCQLRQIMAQLSVPLALALALGVTQLVTLLVSLFGETMIPDQLHATDWFWVLRNQLVSAIFAGMALRYFYVQNQLRIRAKAELQARLMALQANIRPHFFFNTLNTVSSLIAIDPDKAEGMLLNLADLFRAVLKNDDALTSLEEEVHLCRRYLDIEQTRLGARLQIDDQLPQALPDIEVPQLILQPLLENAVYHGIEPDVRDGFIRLQLKQDGNDWLLSITNSKAPAGQRGRANGHGLAQQNIQARLEARFGPGQWLQTREHSDHYEARILLSRGEVS